MADCVAQRLLPDLVLAPGRTSCDPGSHSVTGHRKSRTEAERTATELGPCWATSAGRPGHEIGPEQGEAVTPRPALDVAEHGRAADMDDPKARLDGDPPASVTSSAAQIKVLAVEAE